MEPLLAAALVFGGMFLLLLLGMPLGFAMTAAGFVGSVVFIDFNAALSLLGQTTSESARSHEFAVIPLFILMGAFVSRTGLTEDLFEAFNTWLGQLRGGLALATVASCGAFAAVCGSSVATAATMTHVALPEMRRRKYSDSLATGAIAAGGTLGILIPPSILMVIYGIFTETSISDLFLAGVVPGVLSILLFMAAIAIIVRANPAAGPAGDKSSLKAKLVAFKGIWGMAVLFGLVMGGIYSGIFSPEEAAGIGAFGGLLLGLIGRRMTWSLLGDCLMDTARTTAMLFMILIGAFLFKNFLALSGLASDLGTWVSGLTWPPLAILIVILLIYLALGCVLDSIAMIVLTLPIFFPITQDLGFDPVWYGILMVIVVEIAMITPPIGINVFVIAGMAPDIRLTTIFRGVMPFVLADLLLLALLIAFPAVALWLPTIAKSMLR